MVHQFLIDSCQSVNTVLQFYAIETDWSTLNVSNYNTQSIENCSKKQERLSVKLIKLYFSRNLKNKRSNCDVFYEGFGSFFWDLNLIPLIHLSLNQIIFLLVVDNLHKLLCDFHNQVNKILWDFYYKIIKLDFEFVNKSILLESFIFVDVSIKDGLRFYLT